MPQHPYLAPEILSKGRMALMTRSGRRVIMVIGESEMLIRARARVGEWWLVSVDGGKCKAGYG